MLSELVSSLPIVGLVESVLGIRRRDSVREEGCPMGPRHPPHRLRATIRGPVCVCCWGGLVVGCRRVGWVWVGVVVCAGIGLRTVGWGKRGFVAEERCAYSVHIRFTEGVMFGAVGPFYPPEWAAVVGYGAL